MVHWLHLLPRVTTIYAPEIKMSVFNIYAEEHGRAGDMMVSYIWGQGFLIKCDGRCTSCHTSSPKPWQNTFCSYKINPTLQTPKSLLKGYLRDEFGPFKQVEEPRWRRRHGGREDMSSSGTIRRTIRNSPMVEMQHTWRKDRLTIKNTNRWNTHCTLQLALLARGSELEEVLPTDYACFDH